MHNFKKINYMSRAYDKRLASLVHTKLKSLKKLYTDRHEISFSFTQARTKRHHFQDTHELNYLDTVGFDLSFDSALTSPTGLCT